MKGPNMKHKQLFIFSIIRRCFYLFLTFNILFLFFGFTSKLYSFKPPPPPTEEKDVFLRLKLYSPSKTWGRPIPGASGEIYYKKEYDRQFVINIKLRDFLPNHKYILSLNGKPWHESNRYLPQRYGQEGVYNFETIFTDDLGSFGKDNITIDDLPTGTYNVKFFLKDPANDWKVVAYNDFFIFRIR